jgi:hypothetical protein
MVLKEAFTFATYAICSKNPVPYMTDCLNSLLNFIRYGLGEDFFNDSQIFATTLVRSCSSFSLSPLTHAYTHAHSLKQSFLHLYTLKLSFSLVISKISNFVSLSCRNWPVSLCEWKPRRKDFPFSSRNTWFPVSNTLSLGPRILLSLFHQNLWIFVSLSKETDSISFG